MVLIIFEISKLKYNLVALVPGGLDLYSSRLGQSSQLL